MDTEIQLLYRLVFSRTFRQSLADMSMDQRKAFLRGWGVPMEFLDLAEVSRFADLTKNMLIAGLDRGGSELRSSYAASLRILEEQGINEDETFDRFLESRAFDKFIEIESHGQSFCLEEAFYRFASMELPRYFNSCDAGLTLVHESLHCITRRLASRSISPESVCHPLLRSTGCGKGGILLAPRRIVQPAGTESARNGSDEENIVYFYFAGRSFICGEISPSAQAIIEFAMMLDEPIATRRRYGIEIVFRGSRVAQRLISLGIV
jgi:hypothetical protein